MMKIERKTHRDGNLHPQAFNCLKHLPTNFSYDKNHKDLPPFSIYTNSIQKIMESFNAVLDEIDQVFTASFNDKGTLDYSLKKLANLQIRLLHTLESHIDDCYHILKVIYPNNSEVQEKYIEIWLKKVEHPAYEQFKNAIYHYRKSFAPIVNKIKHNGANLRFLIMYPKGPGIITPTEEKSLQGFPKNIGIIGYYLEGMQPNGRIGPDYEIHSGGKTAISFNCNLRYHFGNIYRVGELLRTAIAKTVHNLHGAKLPYDAPVNDIKSQYDIELIAERVSKLPPLFFPDEFSKKTPSVKFNRHNRNADLILEVPGSQYMAWKEKPMIWYEIHLDAVCSDYQLPYYPYPEYLITK